LVKLRDFSLPSTSLSEIDGPSYSSPCEVLDDPLGAAVPLNLEYSGFVGFPPPSLFVFFSPFPSVLTRLPFFPSHLPERIRARRGFFSSLWYRRGEGFAVCFFFSTPQAAINPWVEFYSQAARRDGVLSPSPHSTPRHSGFSFRIAVRYGMHSGRASFFLAYERPPSFLSFF